MEQSDLLVRRIRDGTVIDHINEGSGLKVLEALGIDGSSGNGMQIKSDNPGTINGFTFQNCEDGIHFDFDHAAATSEGTEEYPLTQFGGRYGWDMDKGDVIEDDGITPKLGYSIALRVNYTIAESGLYKISAKIVRQGG